MSPGGPGEAPGRGWPATACARGAGLGCGQAPAGPHLPARAWGPASPRSRLGTQRFLSCVWGPSISSLVSGSGQGRGEAQGTGVGLAWPSPVCSLAPEPKPRPGKPRLSRWQVPGAPERLEAGILPPHRALTSYLLLPREQVETGGVSTQVVSAASVAPGTPRAFGVSPGDGVFKPRVLVEHRVGRFLLHLVRVLGS